MLLLMNQNEGPLDLDLNGADETPLLGTEPHLYRFSPHLMREHFDTSRHRIYIYIYINTRRKTNYLFSMRIYVMVLKVVLWIDPVPNLRLNPQSKNKL